MFCSCRISTDKRVARSLCHSRATCLKLFELNAEVARHADILATILTRMSARMSVLVSWNASYNKTLVLSASGQHADLILVGISRYNEWALDSLTCAAAMYQAKLSTDIS